MLFKEISLPSGFVEKRLRELLETHEKPNPKKNPDRLESITELPDDEYRVRWISADQFEFKCFKYIESRNYSGFVLADRVKVQLAGHADHPILKIHLQKKWFSLLKATVGLWASFVISSLIFYIRLWIQDSSENFYISFWVMGVLFALIYLFVVIKIMTVEDICVTRLRHLLARDDWDPGAVKPN